ncbi:hypothetical protein E2C01_080398 [Portunus trituberculatus]|uniref:Uncharacterized protein n=1 Tax=Portunus trituberculatus TaxID=210409 RepID=A0A5B7IW10_PORTR|nr:hypothetical protein [Portunus trituberculatus]
MEESQHRKRKQESEGNKIKRKKNYIVSARANLCWKVSGYSLHFELVQEQCFTPQRPGCSCALHSPGNISYCRRLAGKCHSETARRRQVLFSPLEDVGRMDLVGWMLSVPLLVAQEGMFFLTSASCS